VGSESVDLTARTSGLLPFWLFLIALGVWLVIAFVSWRGRDTYPQRLPAILAVGSLILANVLFFWRPLFTAAHLPRGGGDLNSFFFTLHAYSADRITSGEIPLWNPYLHGGMPHLANFQAGLLYPPNVIAYLVAQPFSYGALEWLAILHYLIASIGVYLLLRSLGAGRIGAILGGIIFAYGGFFVAHLGHYSMISAAAWIPWLFWIIHRLVVVPRWWSITGLAVLVFLTATAGHQQTLLFALAGAGLWWVFLVIRGHGVSIPGVGSTDAAEQSAAGAWTRLWGRSVAISLGQFILGVGTGLLLAAPMILPSLQLAQRSVRSTLSIEQASEFNVQPVALLHLFLPTVFGSNPTDYWGTFSSGEIWGYVGVTTMIVAVLGLVLRPSATRWFFAGVAGIALLYAVGPAAPIHGWFYQFVPGFDLVRAPARAYVFFNLSFAVLAGLAVTDIVERLRSSDVAWRGYLDRTVRVLIIAIGAVGLFMIPLFYSQILGVNDPPNRPVITVDNLWMLLIFVSLLALILWLARRHQLRGAALGLALGTVMVLDLFSATIPFNPVDEDLVDGYREPQITAFLDERWDDSEPFRVDVRHPGLLPNFGMIDGVHVASGVFDPMQPAAYTGIHDRLAENPEAPAYDLLNVRYWIVPSDTELIDGFEVAFESSAGTHVWERQTARPRAWIVSDVRAVSHDEQLEEILDSDYDPSTTVLLEDPPISPDGDVDGSVEILRYSPERITLDVSVEGPAYVVLSDGNYPGWTAEIDGESVSVMTANYGIRAIPVDSSNDVIEMRYSPGTVTVGLVGAGLGVLLLVGILAGPMIGLRIARNRIS
jgi:hypothetical protein